MTPAEAIAVAQGWAAEGSPRPWSPGNRGHPTEQRHNALTVCLDALPLAEALYAEHSAAVAEHGLLWDEHVECCGSASCVVLAGFVADVARLRDA